MTDQTSTWRFPAAFWTGNAAELCERAAYYGTFIALRTYLLRVVGLGDVEAGVIAGIFGALIYFFPFFTGALADRMGFRNALMLAFALLTVGYGTLGVFSTLGPVLVGLLVIVIGGAFVKPVITGTVSKSSDPANRARAFSIFYMVVNIGSFTGKTIVAPMRIEMGVDTVPFFSSAASLVALVLVFFVFRPPEDGDSQPRNIAEVLQGMWLAVSNLRFLALILITAGFWAIQGQLYAAMPDYVLRMAGETYKPEWYANVNPLVVVLLVVLVTQLVRDWKPQSSMLVAMTMIPMSALAMASSAAFRGPVEILGLSIHPITLMMVVGISIQGLAECFLSPKYLEFASKQAPKGKEGVFLGFAHMNTFFAWLFGFILSGFLLARFCPEPTTLPAAVQEQHALALAGQAPMPEVYAHAHYLWIAYSLVGLVSLAALLIFIAVTNRIDAGTRTPGS
ncbi:MAG: MFS transporter [Thermoanaerobaculales bacterium]|jgi:dipeptide/tripeptide permease|nr:MFS transporter [Thermoanaerobaculales bacterium]